MELVIRARESVGACNRSRLLNVSIAEHICVRLCRNCLDHFGGILHHNVDKIRTVRIAIFDTHSFDRAAFTATNERYGFDLTFFEPRLTEATAGLAVEFPVVCSFVNDRLDAEALAVLHGAGVRLIALRSAGYNHVDLHAAADLSPRRPSNRREYLETGNQASGSRRD